MIKERDLWHITLKGVFRYWKNQGEGSQTNITSNVILIFEFVLIANIHWSYTFGHQLTCELLIFRLSFLNLPNCLPFPLNVVTELFHGSASCHPPPLPLSFASNTVAILNLCKSTLPASPPEMWTRKHFSALQLVPDMCFQHRRGSRTWLSAHKNS